LDAVCVFIFASIVRTKLCADDALALALLSWLVENLFLRQQAM
jgi:hypothetical protein